MTVINAMRTLWSPTSLHQVCHVPSNLLSAVAAFLTPYTALLEDSLLTSLASHIITGEFLFTLVGMFLQLVNKVSAVGPHVKCTLAIVCFPHSMAACTWHARTHC